MHLEPLIKNAYSLEEVSSRWQQIHKDYGMEFLQEKIAREEIPAYINLRNCLLFPVSEVNKLYKYLELHISPTKRGQVYVDAIHESNHELITRRLTSRKTFYVSAWVFADAQLENSPFNRTSPGKYTKTFGNQDLSELFLNEKHLLSSEHNINHHYVESNCRTDIETVESDDHEPIIRVECPIAVTPFAQSDNPFGISFTPPEEVQALSKINLSNLGGELISKLSQASVVLWRGKFYYVVNKNTNAYKDQEYQCLSLSSDVLKSYQEAGGAVILKEDIEAFEQNLFFAKSSQKAFNPSSLCIQPEEVTLKVFQSIMDSFKHSKAFKEHGEKTHQNLIIDWLEKQVPKSKTGQANRDYIRVLKVLISEKYGITTLRSNSLS